MPLLLEYFIPGFIFMITFNFLVSKNQTSHFIILCIAFSYILKSIYSMVHKIIFVNICFDDYERAIILSLSAFLIAVLFTFVYESKPFNKFLKIINHKTIHNDIWKDIINYDKGVTLRIKCDNFTCIGVLDCHEENGLESWFILEDYILEDNDKILQSSELENIHAKIAINLRDAKCIELFTHETD